MSRRISISLWEAMTEAFPSRPLCRTSIEKMPELQSRFTFLYLYIGTTFRRVNQSLRRPPEK
ncbi:hypothetical protein ACSS6W_000502 [Trichoderma asperelloides]